MSFNSQAFQEEHTERKHTGRITNVFTICDHIMNDLAPPCTMCGKRIANKEDLKRHMTLGAAKGNIDAKFLVW